MSLSGQTDFTARARIAGRTLQPGRAPRAPTLASRLRGHLPTIETAAIVACTVTPLVVAACSSIG
jgi:hypothetical protein